MIQDLLPKALTDLGEVEIIEMPRHGDRMVRLRTLEDMLDDFERDGDDQSVGYLLRVRPTPKAAPAPSIDEPRQESERDEHDDEGVYLADGKLNALFLLRNAKLLLDADEIALARNVYKTLLQAGERTAAALFGLGAAAYRTLYANR